MKIGMLTQWYDPETGPAALPGVYAREFVEQGHQVSVLTGFPNYPTGSLYPGYKLTPRALEGKAPLRVTRVALYPNHSRSVMGRVANYTSFAACASLLGAGALRGADVIWAYSSPPTVALPMFMHSRCGQTPVFLHIQDLWPDSLLSSGMFPRGLASRIANKALSSLIRFTEDRATFVGVISPGVRELILERNPRIEPRKIVYAPNPADESTFTPVPSLRTALGICPPGDQFELMYVGAVGEIQGLDTLIDAAVLLRDQQGIRITVVGDGIAKERLERRVADERLRNVSFVGRVPQSEVPALLARSHLQLVSLANMPFLEYTMPSKIASLLASEVPILAQLSGDGAEVIRESGAGLVVEPGNADSFAMAVREVAAMSADARASMARRGRVYYDRYLSASSTSAKILSALSSVA